MCEKRLRKLYLNTSKSNLTLAYDEGLGKLSFYVTHFLGMCLKKKAIYCCQPDSIWYSRNIDLDARGENTRFRFNIEDIMTSREICTRSIHLIYYDLLLHE